MRDQAIRTVTADRADQTRERVRMREAHWRFSTARPDDDLNVAVDYQPSTAYDSSTWLDRRASG